MAGSDSPLASSDWAGFVAAIRFQPAEDVPRLAAADWLTDTGCDWADAWAAFIRLQVEAARSGHRIGHGFVDSCDCVQCRDERQATALFDRWGPWWWHHSLGDTDAKVAIPNVGHYRRGFVETLRGEMEGWKVAHVPANVAAMFTHHPIKAAVVQLRHRPYIRGLAEWVLTVVVRETASGLGLSVRGNLSRPRAGEVPYPAVDANRIAWATHPQSFPRMVRAVCAEVLRKRGSIIFREQAEVAGSGIIDTGSLRRSLP